MRTKARGTWRAQVRHVVRASLFVPVLAVLLGCGPALRDVASDATPGVVEGTVDGVVDPENQKKLAYGIDDALVAEATDRMVSGIVDGAMQSLEDPKRREELRALVGELVGDGRVPLTLTIDSINRSTVGDTVDEAITRMSSEPNQEQVREVTRLLVKEVIGTAVRSARQEVDTEGVGETLSAATREMAKQATLGFQDAIDETRAKKDAGHLPERKGNVLDAAARAAEQGSSYLTLAVAALGGFAAALLGAVLLGTRRSRASRGELARRDEALLILARAIKSTEGEAWSPALRRAIKEAVRDEEGGDYLRKLLREHRELRLGTTDREPADPKGWHPARA